MHVCMHVCVCVCVVCVCVCVRVSAFACVWSGGEVVSVITPLPWYVPE